MRILQAIIFLAFLAAVGIFAAQNTQDISVRFLSWSFEKPTAIFLVVVYFLGMLSGWTVVAFVRGSMRRVSERPRG